MKVNTNIKWAAITLILCLITGSVTYYVTNGTPFAHTQPELHANVFALYEGIGGIEDIGGANVITNIGEAYVRDNLAWMNASAQNTTTVIGIGNITSGPNASTTQFDTECYDNGFGRVNGTTTKWTNGTFSAFNVTVTYQCVTAARTLNCAGLFWNTGNNTNNSMFAAASITQTQFNVGDNCTLTWVITVAKS